MPTIRPKVTGRTIADDPPLAVTVKRASELSGLGLTSIWAFLRDGRLEPVRVPGVRRTLVSYPSLLDYLHLRLLHRRHAAVEAGRGK
jgi:hypothetical protein